MNDLAWAINNAVHRVRKGHWPEWRYLETWVGNRYLYNWDCAACKRDPPNRGRFIPVMQGMR